ncbi:site-specific integrase (plasmid) [Halorussus salilacus]|uniref:tyrosine-type recombinase/integrase n=1 Tax=Halorussus salilacus TaxID=2953750 RepID=UPI00209E9B58|nr:site-specific integrase [Halorussus salilacus]USZ69827.1 site-specific integrase [Halorussus salilacus]
MSESPDSDPFGDVRWTTCSLEDFRDLYWEVVAPRLEAEGRDPENHRPTHEWFRDSDLRAFLAALRRYHGRSFGDFWREDLGLGGEGGYDWATDHGETREALEAFLDRRRTRHSLADSTVETKRRRLNLYVRAYREANGTDDLLSPVARDGETPSHEAVGACYSAFDWLDARDYGARTKTRVRSVVDDWYHHLVGRRLAALNPATGLYDEFKWQAAESDPSPLAAEHVRALVDAAETARERLLVVALAGWGLRANEVASLRVSQFVRDVGEDESPYVTFDERKNGPGEVNVVYGLDALDARVDELADREDWTGHLFPSRQGDDPHVTRERIWAWFRDLAERAGLPEEIDGERPSPQLCRRFWYDTYTSVLEAVLEGVEDIAAEQGSSDPRVVMSNYLSDERARRLRREFMREELRTAFGHRP